MAEEAIALGYYVSFSGIVTFKNAAALRAVAAKVPADRLLVETDAPWLAPVPHRGRQNEPALLPHTAAVLAQCQGVSPEALARQTTENYRRLFARTSPRPKQPILGAGEQFFEQAVVRFLHAQRPVSTLGAKVVSFYVQSKADARRVREGFPAHRFVGNGIPHAGARRASRKRFATTKRYRRASRSIRR